MRKGVVVARILSSYFDPEPESRGDPMGTDDTFTRATYFYAEEQSRMRKYTFKAVPPRESNGLFHVNKRISIQINMAIFTRRVNISISQILPVCKH